MLEALNFVTAHKTYFACFLSSLVLALVLTPLAGRLAGKLGAIDQPNHRKVHSAATPQMGGLAVYFALWLPILALYFWENAVNARLDAAWWNISIVAAAGGVMMLLGMLDDLKGLTATKKLLVQVPLAYLFASHIAHFQSITVPGIGSYELGAWGVPLTMLWVVGITNALNLVDGIDGLASGVAIVVAFTNSIIALISGNDFLAIVMLAMTGSCLGFLYYNFAPAKIFLGDTGSLFLGMTLATASVLTVSKSDIAASFLVAVLLLGYPVMDTLLAMTRRKIYGRPMFSADLGHIHHRLLAKGLDHPKASLAIYGLCGCFSLAALAMVLQNSAISFCALLLLAGVVFAALRYIGFFKLLEPKVIQRQKANYLIAYHLGELFEAKLSLADDLKKIQALFRQACAEFGFSSLTLRLDPVLVRGDETGEMVWANPEAGQARHIPPSRTAKESFTARDGFLEVEYLYDRAELEDELAREYRMQMTRLTNSAALRIKELMPVLSRPSKESDVNLREQPAAGAEISTRESKVGGQEAR